MGGRWGRSGLGGVVVVDGVELLGVWCGYGGRGREWNFGTWWVLWGTLMVYEKVGSRRRSRGGFLGMAEEMGLWGNTDMNNLVWLYLLDSGYEVIIKWVMFLACMHGARISGRGIITHCEYYPQQSGHFPRQLRRR